MKKNRACSPHKRGGIAVTHKKPRGGTMTTIVPKPAQGRAADILARLDRLPGTRHVWMLITLLSLGGMFELYDLFMTAYVVPGLMKAGLLTSVSVSIFTGPGAVRRRDLLRPVHRHLRVRLCRRQIRPAHHLHLFDAVVLRRDTRDGLSEHRLRRQSVAADRRHRHRRRAGHDRHLSRPSWCRSRCAAAPSRSIRPSSSAVVPIVAFIAYMLVPISPFGFEAGDGSC